MTGARPTYSHCVVLGDLVASEAAPSVARLHAAFNDAVQSANRRWKTAIVSPLTITLGDEFQGLTPSLASGLAIVRDLRQFLFAKQIECRFVLGLVRVDVPVNAKSAWNMMGPGLASARDVLNDKRAPNAYRFSLPRDPVLETLLNAIGLSITDIEKGWTERQAEIVARSLANQARNVDLAKRLGLAPRTLYKILRAARIDLYENQWAAVDSAVADLDLRYKLGG